MKQSLDNWKNTILSNTDGWKANNIHIDEIDSKYLDRKTWIEGSFEILKHMLESKLFIYPNHQLFLHFDLKDSKTKNQITNLNYDVLYKNLSQFTPPSFNYLSNSYFNQFQKELKEVENNFTDIDLNNKLKTYFRTYYDEKEKMYSGEIYLFPKM